MADHWYKDPDDSITYKFDWAPLENGTGDSNWLDRTSSPIESIADHTITIDSPGVTIDHSSISDNASTVTVTISGGTAGKVYPITCQITTSASPAQTPSRTAYLHVSNR